MSAAEGSHDYRLADQPGSRISRGVEEGMDTEGLEDID